MKLCNENILSLPKTIYFCFKYFPFGLAIKLPVFVSYNVVLVKTKGKVILDSQHIKTGMVKLGFGFVEIFDKAKSRTIFQNEGTIIFRGEAKIGHGSKISVAPHAQIEVGDKFDVTAESQICCRKHIVFGNNVLISWQCLLMDTDWHDMFYQGGKVNNDEDIIIGNNVWIGCRSTILKGVIIGDGCVIAANSHVVKSCLENNILIGGNPALMLKKGVYWKK